MRNTALNDWKDKINFLKMKTIKRINPSNMSFFNQTFDNFIKQFKSRYSKCKRYHDRFLELNTEWLNASISFVPPPNKRGRKELSFEDCSEKTKSKKTRSIRESISLPVLTHATQMSLRASGNVEAAKLVKEITTSTPTRAAKYRKSFKQAKPKQLSAEEALSVLIEAKLTRHSYNIIRRVAPEKFPSYTKVQQAKQRCYPKRDQVKFCETSAQVSLQGLLNHTVERLVMLPKCYDILTEKKLSNLTLFSKWGFDGSSGHSSYKQAFYSSNASDSSVFITSIVPLKLVSGNEVVWKNPRPSSTRFCRPLKIEYTKETTSVSNLEKIRVEDEKKNLEETLVLVGENSLKVHHDLFLVMIDGKVCNAITGTNSTQKCYVCGATSKMFNSVDSMIVREVRTDTLEFGLSILHGWIRFFECLLHLSYKIPIKKWQARSDEDKKLLLKQNYKFRKSFVKEQV